jgi:hypothetical protein
MWVDNLYNLIILVFKFLETQNKVSVFMVRFTLKVILFYFFFIFLSFQSYGCTFNCGSSSVIPQKDPGGPAVKYGNDYFTIEIPEMERPNDATISLYEDGRRHFLEVLKEQREIYTIAPKGNAEPFKITKNPKSKILETQLSEGYILSYLYYDNGIIKYNGLPKSGRFDRDIDNKTQFFTHSTGKSIVSYIVGHAICEGNISSINEPINWPLMNNTVYDGQPLINLLNMNAGDEHTVNPTSSRVMGSNKHHRDIDHISVAELLRGTKRKGNKLFYNNILTDIIASYVAYKVGDDYEKLLKMIFQDKIKIENKIYFQLHTKTSSSKLKEKLQTRSSYSFLMTRGDLLRLAISMMRDYQDQTCVGNYLRELQAQAVNWPKYRPSKKIYEKASLYIHNYSKKYGGKFYFDFHKMDGRNIIATEGLNGQNILIDLDKSRIVVTQSAANGWDMRTFMLNVIRDGKLPK